MVRQSAGRLETVMAAIRNRLDSSDVVHADESGLRVHARLNWVHSNSTDTLTLYHLDQRRGTTAMDAMGVLEHLRGVLVHDGWAPYRKHTKVRHALCNAHHIRELQAATEAGGQPWASDMITLLSDTWQLVLTAQAADRSTLSDEESDTSEPRIGPASRRARPSICRQQQLAGRGGASAPKPPTSSPVSTSMRMTCCASPTTSA